MIDIIPEWPPGADFHPKLSKRFYVIIGAGFSALLNHRLLLHTPTGQARLGKVPVLHIGGADPWTQYDPDASMGQWPSLLSLPLLSATKSRAKKEDFLSCGDFANQTIKAWKSLPKFYALSANVYRIVEDNGGYVVRCFQGKQRIEVKADKVDICAGPGPSRRWRRSFVKDSGLWEEYKTGLAGASGIPRLVTGETFLHASTSAGKRVAVIGGGPTSAWCVEKAQQFAKEVFWISKDSLNPAFLPTRRNDELAQGSLWRERRRGELVVTGPLFPQKKGTIFAEGFEIGSVTAPSGNAITLNLRQVPGFANCRSVDSDQRHVSFGGSVTCEQVVVSIGQMREQHERGSWSRMVAPLVATARNHQGKFLLRNKKESGDERVVGIQSFNGNLRLLGASALNHPEAAPEWLKAKSLDYLQSLPQQAQVLVGIALSAVTIGLANGLFTTGATTNNLNLATERELEALIGPQFAKTWIEMRATRIHPFTSYEMKATLNKTRYRFE